MKACTEIRVQFPSFITKALDGGEWSALGPGHFSPPPSHCTNYAPKLYKITQPQVSASGFLLRQKLTETFCLFEKECHI